MKPSDHHASLKSQPLRLNKQKAQTATPRSPQSEHLSLEEQRSLLYELQTHQIELDSQNEALQQMQSEMAAAYLRYFELYHHAPIGYCTVSENELIMQANLVASKLLGLQPSEMVDTPITGYIFKEDQDIYYLYRKQFKVGRESQWCELRMVKKDGSLFWAHLVGTTANDINGLPELRFVIKDTTERRQTDRALIDTGQKFQFLFDKSVFGIADCKLVYDALGEPIDYQFLDVNQAYIQLIGINPRYKMATQVFPDIKKYTFDWINIFANVAQTGTQIRFEQLFQFDNRWYECIAYQSKIDHFVVMLMDITERKASEKKQNQHNEQISRYADEIKEIYENAPCGYYSLDINGFFLHINKTALKWLGYSKGEIIKRCSFSDLLLSHSLENYQQSFLQFQKNGEERDLEVELIRKDGSVFPALISSMAVYDEDGYYLMSRSTLYDITERKKMEEEHIQHLKQQEKAARHLVVSQEHLRKQLSSELHDRTSPNLAAININLKVMSNELLAKHSTDFWERMEDTLALIADTNLSIREISTEMRPPLLDYSGLASAIESYAQLFTQRTGVAVQLDCSNQDQRYMPEVESQLFRIFQEALTNCLKHADATLVTATLSSNDHFITLAISDDGVGFNAEQLGKNGDGGLGLLSMREMAEVIGGKFYIESKPGKGTQIVVDVSCFEVLV